MAKTSIYKTDEGKEQIIKYYYSLLSQWTQPSIQFYIDTQLGKTHIIESGNKVNPAILLLHGTGSNSAMWAYDAKILSETFHVFAVDIPGECGKSSENRPDFKDENYSNWISAITENLGLNQVSLIGCSLGGWIAMDYAINHPDKVDKLILMATAGVTQIKLKSVLWIILTSLTGSWGFNQLNKMVYGNLTIDSQALEFAALIKKYFTPRTGALPVFTNESLGKIKASTLFIGGENDCFYNSEKAASRLKEHVDNIQCHVLKNTGHVLIDQTTKILEFLKN
ncbi:alpha/beta fold hydrolase [Saccharicrinis sp. FJH62]|uniref:alpha/beta fold hydrolase n=1 Tax=Saccharicrinis sp. FJH62 TaxID=3344657 RepID=UPI0035D5267F